jgi:hypothetical protein
MSQVISTLYEETYTSNISATDYALMLHGPTNTDSSVIMRSKSTSFRTITDSTVSNSSSTTPAMVESKLDSMPQLRQDGIASSQSDSKDAEEVAISTSRERRKVACSKRLRKKSRYPPGTERTHSQGSAYIKAIHWKNGLNDMAVVLSNRDLQNSPNTPVRCSTRLWLLSIKTLPSLINPNGTDMPLSGFKK